jgi:hypothetical protein
MNRCGSGSNSQLSQPDKLLGSEIGGNNSWFANLSFIAWRRKTPLVFGKIVTRIVCSLFASGQSWCR